MKHKISTLFVLLVLLTVTTAFTPTPPITSITVNSTADTYTVDGLCTLREAISNANADAEFTGGDCVAGSGADTILFDSSLGTVTIILGSQLPAIYDPNGLTIDGDNRITISGGLATFPWNAQDAATLIEQADQAMLRAKRDGKNRIYLVGAEGQDTGE